MRPSGLTRALALIMIAITVTVFPATTVRSSDGALGATSAGNARFEGRVFGADGVSPRPGVVVALFDEGSGGVFRSDPTDEAGAFRIDAAPAGSYAVVTEAPEGSFLAGDNVELASGTNRPLSLTLTATPPTRSLAPGQTQSGQKSGPSAAVKWGITGGIALAALFLINELTDDSEETASDF